MMPSTDPMPSIPERRLIGAVRRFGPFGPAYEVIGPPAEPDQGKMRIRVILSGEEVDYRISEIVDDPED